MVLGNAWLDWVSNGLFIGLRRLEVNGQIDDVFMATGTFDPLIGGEGSVVYRITTSDLQVQTKPKKKETKRSKKKKKNISKKSHSLHNAYIIFRKQWLGRRISMQDYQRAAISCGLLHSMVRR